MDGGKGLNVGKTRPGSNRNVSVSVTSLRPPLDTRRPVVIPKLALVSGVWPTFAAFLPRGRASNHLGCPSPDAGSSSDHSAQATKWLVRGCFLQRSLARLVH
jgi:hypothetical protein